MIAKKLFSVFMLLVLLAGRNTYAQESEDTSETEYVELDEGEAAPHHGYLFSSDSLSAVIAKQDKEKKELRLELETETKKLKLDLETEIKKKESELAITTTKFEDLLKLNKEEIARLNKEATVKSWLSSAGFVTGFVVGSVVTVFILKEAVEVVR